MLKRVSPWFMLLSIFAMISCSDDSPASPECVVGQSVACVCVDGRMGAQVCEEDGTYAACDCSEEESGANACGGVDGLRLDGVAAEPGQICGDCDDGVITCAGPNALKCVGATSLNACGACQTLAHLPGDACGECSTGVYECAGDALECSVDDDLNACGGCSGLDQEPFFTCTIGEVTGVSYCRDADTVVCVGPDSNACGGSDPLAALPTSRCGMCQQGRFSCDGQNAIVCEKSDAGLNACGGCAPLVGQPGDECECGGQWQCDGTDRVVCDGGNLCGGCAELAAAPGSSCGQDQINVCDGVDAVVCVDESTRNACGGTRELAGAPADACGPCDDGVTICVAPDALGCRAPSGRNECGGCAYLASKPGSACGVGGQYECDGLNAVECVGGMGPDDGCGNACDPDQTCVAGTCVDPMEVEGALIAAGGQHTCVFDGALHCWGRNNLGQVGNGTSVRQPQPVEVTGFTDVVDIAASASHTCAVRENGSVWCWGANGQGQVGTGTTSTREEDPVEVSGISDARNVAVGDGYTCVRTSGGEVWCWGRRSEGQTGDGGTGLSPLLTPTEIPDISDFESIRAGSNFTCATRAGGEVWCWGANFNGQLGDGTSTTRPSPTRVPNLQQIQGIGTGSLHACAIQANGSVRCWGANNHGQIDGSIPDPIGGQNNVMTPTLISGASNAIEVTGGQRHSCILQSAGTVRCWGDLPNFSSRDQAPVLGDGSLDGSTLSVAVAGLDDAAALSAGLAHTCAVRGTGNVVCWGIASGGRLGDNQREPEAPRLTPATVVKVGPIQDEAGLCTDGIDNDMANGTDCEDPGCSSTISGGVSGELLGQSNDFSYDASSCGGMFLSDGPDILYRWTAPASGLTEVTLTRASGSMLEGVVVLLDATCPGAQLECALVGDPLTFMATAGQTYQFLVDGSAGMGPAGFGSLAYDLTIVAP